MTAARISLLSVSLLLVALQTLGQEGSPGALLPIPQPVLDRMDPLVREQLRESHAAVEQQLAARARGVQTAQGDASLGAELGRLGMLYMAYELFDEALPVLSNAERLAPADNRWLYYLGLTQQLRGVYDESARYFEHHVKREVTSAASWIRLGEVELRAGRPEAARAAFERARTLDGADSAARFGLGRLAAQAGRFDEAVGHFEAVLAAQPAANAVFYPLALAYRELGENEKARTYLAQRGSLTVSFPDPLNRHLSELATGAGVYLTRGFQALRAGRRDLARQAYQTAVEADPENVSARLAYGVVLGNDGDYEQALEQFQAAALVEPSNPQLHASLGTCLMQLDRVEEAIASYRRSLALAPDYGDARVKLASALARAGRAQEALAALAAQLEREPRDVGALLLRARLARQMGHVDQAWSATVALLGVEPGHVEGRLLEADLQLERGDLAAAERGYGALADDELEGAAAARLALGLGNLASLEGDATRAIAQYEQAIEHDASLHLAHFQRANVLARSGRFADAASGYAETVAVRPRFEPAHLRRAQALLLLDRQADAREALEEAVAAVPRSIELRHELARLLATSSEDAVRDGARALSLAQEVVGERRTADFEETVAMAFAELGDFARARTWQERVVARTRQAGRTDLLAGQEARLADYRRGQPCRTPWRPGAT